eukprot:2943560-Rhodomonas_salina.4
MPGWLSFLQKGAAELHSGKARSLFGLEMWRVCSVTVHSGNFRLKRHHDAPCSNTRLLQLDGRAVTVHLDASDFLLQSPASPRPLSSSACCPRSTLEPQTSSTSFGGPEKELRKPTTPACPRALARSSAVCPLSSLAPTSAVIACTKCLHASNCTSTAATCSVVQPVSPPGARVSRPP